MAHKHQIIVKSAKGRTNAGKKWRRQRNELYRQSQTHPYESPKYKRMSKRKLMEFVCARELSSLFPYPMVSEIGEVIFYV
jgi:hypothetical protein